MTALTPLICCNPRMAAHSRVGPLNAAFDKSSRRDNCRSGVESCEGLSGEAAGQTWQSQSVIKIMKGTPIAR